MGKHGSIKIWQKYEGGKLKADKCPRCGSILADHENRKTCGRCGYSEILKLENG